MAMKGKMEITLGVAIGSSIQIAVGVSANFMKRDNALNVD